MKSCSEMRGEAKKIVLGNGWFWRLTVVALVLQTITQLVSGLLHTGFQQCGLQTWNDFLVAKARAIQGGLDLTVPSRRIAWQMTEASAFETFIVYIFAAIAVFGVSTVLIKAHRNDSSRWFAKSLGGFARPLELAWLMFLMNLKVFLWSLLFVIPGLVAAYRYRQAWFLKVENPDWGASKCIAESGRLMKGRKWKAFCLDLSYFWWLLFGIILVGGLVVSGQGALGAESVGVALLSSVCGLVATMLLIFIFWYFMAGRTVFYRAIKDEAEPAAPAAPEPEAA